MAKKKKHGLLGFVLGAAAATAATLFLSKKGNRKKVVKVAKKTAKKAEKSVKKTVKTAKRSAKKRK